MISIHIRLRWLLLSCLLFQGFFASVALAKENNSPQDCGERLVQPSFAQLGRVRVGTLNLQDLALPESPIDLDPKTRQRAEVFAKTILASKLDIVAVQEMVNDAEFRFVREFLDGAYDFYRTDYQANRGIHNALLLRKGLPLQLGKPRSFGHDQWSDPRSESQASVPLYHRDTPLFEFYAPGWVGREAPVLTIMIAHLKSRKDRLSDFNSNTLRNPDRRSVAMRQAQFERLLHNYKVWQDKHYVQWRKPGAFLLAGDMNGVIGQDEEFSAIANSDLRDAFDVLGVPKDDFSRSTHVYLRGLSALPVFEQINYLLLSPPLQAVAKRAKVDLYGFPAQRFREGTEGLWEAAHALPSRHFAYMIELDLAPLVKQNLAQRPAWAREAAGQ